MDEKFQAIVERNKPFFKMVMTMIQVQCRAGVELKMAIATVIDNPMIWPGEPTEEERTALIAFFEAAVKETQGPTKN